MKINLAFNLKPGFMSLTHYIPGSGAGAAAGGKQGASRPGTDAGSASAGAEKEKKDGEGRRPGYFPFLV